MMNSGCEKLAQKSHVLIVDDDVRILDLVTRYLMKQDFVVVCAENADEALRILEIFSFDIAVLDVMMPGQNGLELTKILRNSHPDFPIILLTALGEVDDRLAGFEAGADDYLPKPFEPKELVMRLDAIIRRTRKITVSEVMNIYIGPWEFDEVAQVLRSQDENIRLTELEVKLIKVLAQNSGLPLSRENLAKACEVEGSERSIDVQITRLRKKIEEDTKAPLYLQTVRGKGYLLRTRGKNE